MFAGVSGLRSHQLKMDVIGNNIANVNTTGFKASRVTFQEMYSQTLRGASAPTASTGGTNPMQVGLGVSTASIDVLHTGGGFQTTDRPLDFAIANDGFFVVAQATGETFYTRAGNFYLDPSGNLITANGMYVQGLGKQVIDPATGEVTYTPPVVSTPPDPATDDIKADGSYKDTVLNKICIPDTGFYSAFEVDKSGVVSAIVASTNELVVIGQLALGTFVNPGGLTRVGESLYQRSNNSGTPQYWKPNENGASELGPGCLEMSNVDLSKEFTDMIITQRGFQANSRVITVSDTLLEELINLKR